jgi:hypothetical protein
VSGRTSPVRRLSVLALVVALLVGGTVWWRPWAAAWWPGHSAGHPSVAASTPSANARQQAAGRVRPPSVLVAAVGDIVCPPPGQAVDDEPRVCDQELVADLITERKPAAFLALGDIQYDTGDLDAFRSQYAPVFGAFLPITHPVPGNHEYQTSGASGYYQYFGARAGPAGKGWYSFDLGSWHVVALNSNCDDVSCEAGDEQETWLRQDLKAHPVRCTLAIWHHPRWSGGVHGDIEAVGPLVQALHDGGVDLLLTGHDHDYQRFTPMTPQGKADPAHGVREIVVGTGGRNLRPVGDAPGSEKASASAAGALFLHLDQAAYRWEFAPVAGRTFTDSGSTVCH